MSCYIFGAAPISDYSFIDVSDFNKDSDVVICADGGLKHAITLGIAPNLVVGDFDSFDISNAKDYEIIKLQPEKDDTDMKIAIDKGIELGQIDFYIYGGLGGRFDHSMANIQTMFNLKDRGVSLTFVDEHNKMFALKNEVKTIFPNKYKYLSVLSLTETMTVTIRGVKYPVENFVMNYKVPLGVSNEITSDKAVVEVKDGCAIIILAE